VASGRRRLFNDNCIALNNWLGEKNIEQGVVLFWETPTQDEN
jgi:hypothetical protein